MWTCPKCKRVFQKKGQTHSCETIPLEMHFENKGKSKEIFDFLVREINAKIGKVKVISLPCCIHLFGNYDFLAVLPKKDKLELRFVLPKPVKSKRMKISAKSSSISYTNCLDVAEKEKIDTELLEWLKESYYLKERI